MLISIITDNTFLFISVFSNFLLSNDKKVQDLLKSNIFVYNRLKFEYR